MSFKDALLYDMHYIIKKIDVIEDEELEDVYRITYGFIKDISKELTERNGYEDMY